MRLIKLDPRQAAADAAKQIPDTAGRRAGRHARPAAHTSRPSNFVLYQAAAAPKWAAAIASLMTLIRMGSESKEIPSPATALLIALAIAAGAPR